VGGGIAHVTYTPAQGVDISGTPLSARLRILLPLFAKEFDMTNSQPDKQPKGLASVVKINRRSAFSAAVPEEPEQASAPTLAGEIRFGKGAFSAFPAKTPEPARRRFDPMEVLERELERFNTSIPRSFRVGG
jgi:hypothetical protein